MGRKMRSSVLLVLVLILIYTQQAVIYAQNDGGQVEVQVIENTDEIEQPELPEVPDSPEQSKVEKYNLEMPEVDGNNGYYVTKPLVKIVHNGRYGATLYELKSGESIFAQGRLECEEENGKTTVIDKKDEEWKKEVVLDPEVFQEGMNRLHMTMEDEEGNLLPEYEATIDFLIDTKEPTVELRAPEGFSTWYQKEAWIQVFADDDADGSQIDQVVCYVKNQIVGKSQDNLSDFLIMQTSESGEGVPVTVSVTDKAGNKVERTEKIYIDNLAPTVSMIGASDYLITSKPVTLEYQAKDENKLESVQARIEFEKPEGEKLEEVFTTNDSWEITDQHAKLIRTFEEDGIYKSSIQAVDKANQKSERSLQFIIDSQNPIIKMVDELQGKYFQKFSWDYPIEVFIKDFTTFMYQIQMDGRLYPIGTEIDREGRHSLQVNAIDAAGNQSVAKAEFIIDHTPPVIQFHQVEEGKQYEGILNFQVDLEKKEDQIEEIKINGKRQKLKKENGKYPFRITNLGEYEVSVTASDYAGNETKQHIAFEIVPEKTILEKAAEPIKKMLAVKSDSEDRSENNYIEDKKGDYTILKWIVSASIITILLFCIKGRMPGNR